MEELINSFKKLDKNDQRNELNIELQLLGALLKRFELKKGLNPNINIDNYDKNKDKDLTESEILSRLYEDVYSIEREILKIFSYDMELEKLNNKTYRN